MRTVCYQGSCRKLEGRGQKAEGKTRKAKLRKKIKVKFVMSYRNIITIEPGKRGGKPCIRGMRITVYDVLGWLAAGMSHAEILDDFPELTEEDIRACLEFAADSRDRM